MVALRSVKPDESAGRGYDPTRIRECETGAEALQWEAAERIYAGRQAGMTVREIGEEIGKSFKHASLMATVWSVYLGTQPDERPPFNEAYQAAKKPKDKPVPDPEPAADEPDDEPESDEPENTPEPREDTPADKARKRLIDIGRSSDKAENLIDQIGDMAMFADDDTKHTTVTLLMSMRNTIDAVIQEIQR